MKKATRKETVKAQAPRLRILVIDDTELHHQAARQTLAGHELTIVGTYDEAYVLLEKPQASYEAVKAELKRRGFKDPYADSTTEQEREAAIAEQTRLYQELCPPPPFDVVLTDLLMPAGRVTQGPDGMRYVGQEIPVGFALSLMAVLQGAKYVAVATATNHHNHPASAMLDRLNGYWNDESEGRVPFTINGAPVGYFHAPMTHVDGTTCPDCNGSGRKDVCSCAERNAGRVDPKCNTCGGVGRYCWACQNSGKKWGKDWGKILARLLKEKPAAG